MLPPQRTTHTWRSPAGAWCYDTWGNHGRPIVLIPAVMFDRSMWWPVAAELRPHATVIAVDLPGHGDSPGRDQYDPDDLVGELALLLHTLGVRQAPIVVGHATAAPLAVSFAARCVVHAVVTVDPPHPHSPVPDLDQYVAGFDFDSVPPHYRDLITPSTDPRLLTAYGPVMRLTDPAGNPPAAGRPAQVAIHSQQPPRSPAADDRWRRHVYNLPGRFAHLTDQPRFADDIRALLRPDQPAAQRHGSHLR
ncbi:alpha/beta fold hydrolase [Actinoplanes sp. NPDC049599]|uniref:alpha/beta fold hydrolase n=1 Tax=Actinoplanes sp. NPDC049599 TaxID=3363903 RepID=UPI0037AC0B32